MGYATPEFSNLQVNTSRGPEASGFSLTTWPDCKHGAVPTQPDALNPFFLRPYPLCPPCPTCVSNPVCSQGVSSQRVWLLTWACTHTHGHAHTHTHIHIHTHTYTHPARHTWKQKVPLALIYTSTNMHPKHTYERAPVSKHKHPIVQKGLAISIWLK